jgi:hypothetical protein
MTWMGGEFFVFLAVRFRLGMDIDPALSVYNIYFIRF